MADEHPRSIPCTACRNADGVNNGKCPCSCHLSFEEKVQVLLNQNTEGPHEN